MKFILTSSLLTGIYGFPAPGYGTESLMRRQQVSQVPIQGQTQAQVPIQGQSQAGAPNQAGGSESDVNNRFYGYPYWGYPYYPYNYPYSYYWGYPYGYWRSNVDGGE